MQVPAPFEYERASSVEDALALLERLGPDARVIAGGHSLLPMMKLRLAAPEHLVDINDLRELDYISDEGGEVRVGAMTRHRALLESALLGERFPIIHDAERVIADPLVRNRGTIGGALCQADPSEDLSAVCAALGASVVVRGRDGERVLDMVEFHRGPYETAVADGELLVEVRIPAHEHAGSAYEKVERRAGDWAVAAAGAALRMDGGTIAEAGIALSAVGASVTSERAVASLRGATASEEAFAEAGRLAAEDCSPTEDQRGDVAYKRHLAQELTTRALRRAAGRALRQEA
ncbi:FAD binding domain-containing protein [Capillimicrobium parvum]|uniref:Carbon monoxide dehydrogenase medium chain n=1 Tax=Capillimicrobium parvum TaxID=2884022 RepID=A0A9E6Y0X8_9ACTN|nr:xanthine dehydrogenase family protein subunit M [Capillimicrobium parvum]UGS38120.1 Carbon monoxide dehydrogenase medium chain [Capillimicrobium parvum]